jgi:menaquinol-cytochrome c reductase iron-sulfur subunit
MMENERDEKRKEPDENRRKFLVRLTLSLTAVSAAVAGIPVLAALFAPLLRKTPRLWRKVADLEGFAVGAVKLVTFENADPEAWAGETARTAAWLRRETKDKFIAFSANCTHLGCPVRWEADAQLFMCPCHGGVYYKDGTVASGPPPLPLVKYPVRINKKQVEIQTAPVPITTLG